MPPTAPMRRARKISKIMLAVWTLLAMIVFATTGEAYGYWKTIYNWLAFGSVLITGSVLFWADRFDAREAAELIPFEGWIFQVGGSCWTSDCDCREYAGHIIGPDLRTPTRHEGCTCYAAEGLIAEMARRPPLGTPRIF